MASVSATCVRFQTSVVKQSIKNNPMGRTPSLKLVSLAWASGGSHSLRTSRFQISCAAKPETVQKVCEIVRKQLVLPAESELHSASKFSDLGADSLDTVEIVMGLEEEFGIFVEEDNTKNITTVQEAADLVEELVQKKSGA